MLEYNKYEKRGAFHWNEYYNKDGYYKSIVDDSLKYFQDIRRGTLLDVGCGDGLPIHLLAKMGFNCFGVDNSPIGLQFLKEKTKDEEYKYSIKAINKNIEDFSIDMFNISNVDYLYSLNTIEHMLDANKFIELMKRVNEFGIIVTDDFDTKEMVNRYHFTEFNRDSFKKLFKDFKIEEIDINHPGFFGFKIHT